MIRVPYDDVAYMIRFLEMSPELCASLQSKLARIATDPRQVRLGDNEASELRELCQDRLLIVGFDEDYDPNEEGLRLEGLIDKLFTG
ncbi:MAG TPA: hypothetical protein V6D00_01350 [Pantanalinema sp.]